MEQLLAWLAGSFDGWLGLLVALATLSGGGYAGGRAAAIARSRHCDRLALLELVYNATFRRVSNWDGNEKIDLIELALRLPHTDRCVVIGLLDDSAKIVKGAWNEGPVLRVIRFEINPGIGRLGHLWRRIGIWVASPINSRKSLAARHSILTVARQTDPDWGDEMALARRRRHDSDMSY